MPGSECLAVKAGLKKVVCYGSLQGNEWTDLGLVGPDLVAHVEASEAGNC